MKLSHRDFRPPRRSKYVTQPPKRRPTLRILLLGLIGLAVYLKFDYVARLPFWNSLKHAGPWLSARLHAEKVSAPPAPVALRYASDSLSADAECATSAAACLTAGFPLGAEAAGSLREVLGKAASQWDIATDARFSASFARNSEAVEWEPVRIEIRGAHPLSLARKEGAIGAWCAANRCLDERKPQAPLASFRAAEERELPVVREDEARATPWPSARFTAPGSAPVRPILRGRVVESPAPGDTARWLKLHHGGNLFSYYHGLARIDSSVHAGAMVEPGTALGWTAADSADVDLRVESDGRALDPLAFLGLAPGEAHGR